MPGAIGGYCATTIAVGPGSARWSDAQTLRFLADITGTKGEDIVGFGETGVWTSLSNGDGTFAQPRVVLADFGAEANGWQVDKHPRFLADVSGDGKADIVGFGDAGVYVARSNGDGTFAPAQLVVEDFGFDHGWRVDRHPRFVADLTGDGEEHTVGLGNFGVYVTLSKGDGTFVYIPVPVINDFGVNQGWQVNRHPRLLGDVTGDGRSDIVGFGEAGVYVARSNGNGTFAFQPIPEITDFAFDHGWRVDRHPRLLADVRKNGRRDVVGFGDAGVYVSLSGRRALDAPRFVLANFGFEATVLAILQSDRELHDAGVWRSSDRGATWSPVDSFPRSSASAGALPSAGQLVWAPGTAHLVYAAGGSSLAVSREGGATFVDVMPMPSGGFQPVTHVAVAATPTGS